MNTPKVKFTNIPLSMEVNLIYDFLFKNQWGWGKRIIKNYPKTKKVLSFKTKIKQVDFLKKYIIWFKKENQKLIEKNRIEYQKEWQRIEKDFFIVLSEIMQISWPKNRKKIKAMISINPICPRFLNDWSFSIFYNYKTMSRAMEVIMHECCHFLYFEKLIKMFSRISHKKFESPYIDWHLSEILAPIVLNDNRVQKLLKQKAVFYQEHQKLKIKDKNVPKYFTELYKQSIIKNKDFDIFLLEAYKTIKNNKKIFSF